MTKTNGQPDPLAAAIAYEQAIADEAKAMWSEPGITADPEIAPPVPDSGLHAGLFMRLWPLLRRPIPQGFIISTPGVKGKPYESTGIKSLQVQIDRMDNVLTPLHWGWRTEYHESGKLAEVYVWVGGTPQTEPLMSRKAWGGVNQGSTLGNVYKGTETNAAKLAIARIGPGHEVYVGATDLDPDVSPDAAKAQGDGAASAPALDGELVDNIVSTAKFLVDSNVWKKAKLTQQLIAAGASDTSSVSAAIASLNREQALSLKETLDEASEAQAVK